MVFLYSAFTVDISIVHVPYKTCITYCFILTLFHTSFWRKIIFKQLQASRARIFRVELPVALLQFDVKNSLLRIGQ